MTHGQNLKRNFVPTKFITTGFFVRPKQFSVAPGLAVPICTFSGVMSLFVNPILVAKLLDMQHPALFPESTSAEQGMLETETGI